MKSLFAALCALLLATALPAADTPPKPATTVNPGYPADLTDTGIGGTAVILVVVKADGTVGDATVQSTDHPAFGLAALGAIKSWTFEPARRDGQPIERRVSIPFEFNAPVEQVLNASLHRRVYTDLPGPALTAEQYGAAPVIRRAVSAGYPVALLGSGAAADVRVKFVIGPDGSTFNPVVLDKPRKEFVILALTAIAHSAYEPPRKDGKPVYVEAAETVHFADPQAALAAPKTGG